MYNFQSTELLNANDDLQAYVIRINPFLLVLLAILIGSFLMFLFMHYFYSKKVEKQENALANLEKEYHLERRQSDSVLEDLDLGLIVYGIDGKLRMANKRILSMLAIQNVPRTLDEFLTIYGSENGLKASQLLGRGRSEANLRVENKELRLIMKESSFESTNSFSTLIIVSDITAALAEDSQRKEFVANVSHELRTPLTIIRTYAESLVDWGIDEKSPDAIKQDLEKILHDADRMEALIKDLLLLSSLDSKGKAMHMTLMNVLPTVRSTVETCQVNAKEKNIHLECHVLGNIPDVFMDRGSLDRILLNLIQNAIKYTDANGFVSVFVSRLGEDILMKVKDTGKGIEQKNFQAIFDRFFRVDTTGSRKHGGTGLGLSIAKELVELHHGKITVQSVLTQGSEFTVSIPSSSKLFRRLFQESEKTDHEQVDILTQQARTFLLEEAQILGIEKNNLEDFTSLEKDRLLLPYKEEAEVLDFNEDEEVDEDFAGIIPKESKQNNIAPLLDLSDESGEKNIEVAIDLEIDTLEEENLLEDFTEEKTQKEEE